MYKSFLKRVSDIFMSFLAIVILALPMAIIALLIKIDSKGPVFFKQKRIGKNKKTFYILKFRTMRTDAPKDAPTHTLQDPKKWITKIGGFLRKTSIDELPQIFNIFVGHMSVVGPRPALWNQDDLIAERDKYGANELRPGLTGWAQINGRDELPIPIKARLDGEYAERLNGGFFKGIFLDVRCIFGTVFSVLRSDGVVEGASAEAVATAEEKTEEVV
ncbi:MAG: sugar transferase [Clostridia bacterium]|nr:sugar transferase [Clostridia bacterium]